jgi:hypothetical protein
MRVTPPLHVGEIDEVALGESPNSPLDIRKGVGAQ